MYMEKVRYEVSSTRTAIPFVKYKVNRIFSKRSINNKVKQRTRSIGILKVILDLTFHFLTEHHWKINYSLGDNVKNAFYSSCSLSGSHLNSNVISMFKIICDIQSSHETLQYQYSKTRK